MVGTFPLNVQAGSPQYTLTSQITPSSSTSLITVSNPDLIDPISNAYYTIQNEDGSKWCTFYVSNWRVGDLPMTYNVACTYSSSNTSDVFPKGSICWCIWCKEYYDSLITPISTVNNEIDTLTPKIDNSFVNATKIGDTTLRLTRNDGTTVDISFPKGVSVRNVNLTSYQNITANTNELVVITGEFNVFSIPNPLSISGLGYLDVYSPQYDHKITLSQLQGKQYFDKLEGNVIVSGILYNGGKLMSD